MDNTSVVKELTEKLENGVRELFESEKYADYLKTMSRFHLYSTRNTLLIHLQDPTARRVAGYTAWKQNFNRQVKKGEHGIKIFAPIANKDKDIEVEKLDPVTKQPVLDDNGQPIMERLSPSSNLQVRFKIVTVFTERQTEGDPLPELAETLTGDVERYELFMDALRAVSPLPIFTEDLPSDTDGICHFGEKITIRSGMSEIQTVSAVVHEICHAKIHDMNVVAENGEQPQDHRTSEIAAEGVSFVVNSWFGVDTGANSFGYVATWSKGKELKELNAALDTIRKTSASLIDAINTKYHALAKERGIDLNAIALAKAQDTQLTQAPPTAMSANQLYAQYANVVAEKSAQYAISSGILLIKDEMDARRATDQIVNRVIDDMLQVSDEHYSLFNEYRDNLDFRERIENFVFIKSYLEPKNAERKTSQKEEHTTVEYTDFQNKGFAIAKAHAHLPIQERLDIIAQTFGGKTAHIETHPCTGKWRGTSDISIVFDNGSSLFIGNRRTPEAKKASTISECVNNTLAMYNPETVVEAKKRAEFALLKREAEDNAIAAELGLKPYKFLNVEINDGRDAKTGGHMGWYYVTIAVEDKIFGHLTTNLNYDIARGVVGDETKRRNYFVAGGLRDGDEDYVFDNVGHSTTSGSYKMELSDAVLERAKETLERRNNFTEALGGMKTVEKATKTSENNLYDKLTELFPDFMSGKYSYIKLESPGMEPLSLEWIDSDRISIMHTYTMNGDLMYDPMMEFEIDSNEKTISPCTFEQSMPPLYQRIDRHGFGISVDGNGNERTIIDLQKQFDDFTSQWLSNIEQQGYTPVIGNLVRGGGSETRVIFDKDGNMIMPEDEPKQPLQTMLDLSLPDPLTSVSDRNDYGYDYDGMLPLSIGRAVELFDTDHCVYLLYSDNTESMALDRVEIQQHNGLCGIERDDWECSPIRNAQLTVAASNENALESELIHSNENMFGIYQVRDDLDEKSNFCFVSMRELEALGLSVDRENYQIVYAATLKQRFFSGMLNDNDRTLETLFAQFNDSLPSDYTARSVSVSDVIVLQQGGEVTAHYVDSVGFKELPSFTSNEREEQKPTLSLIDTRQTAKHSALSSKTSNKGIPTLMDEINEAKKLVACVKQPTAKQNEREVLT